MPGLRFSGPQVDVGLQFQERGRGFQDIRDGVFPQLQWVCRDLLRHVSLIGDRHKISLPAEAPPGAVRALPPTSSNAPFGSVGVQQFHNLRVSFIPSHFQCGFPHRVLCVDVRSRARRACCQGSCLSSAASSMAMRAGSYKLRELPPCLTIPTSRSNPRNRP